MEIFKHRFVLVVFSILCIISHGDAQNCGLETDIGEPPYIPDDIIEDLLLVKLAGYNIAHVYIQKGAEYYTTISRDENGQQFVSVFVKKNTVDNLDLNGDQPNLYFDLSLLCTDGAFIPVNPRFTLNLTDTNNRTPEFSEREYTSQVSLPWPIQLPIITNVPIFVTDKDHTLSSTLAVSVDRPEILTVSAKQIQASYYSHDFKVELFMSELATPGEYDIELTFYDGVFRSIVPIRLNVTEMVCKLYSAGNNKPVFGGKFEQDGEKIIYKGLLRKEGQKVGDILLMEDGAVIQAHDPDGFCEIEFGANVDFLKIQKNGSITFTKDMSPEEISKLDRKVIEIRANKSGSDEFNKIPLLLSLL